MAVPPPANDSGMPLIEAYTITYVSPALYEISKRAEKITWTFAICLSIAVWDWLVSLPAEWDRIWKREKTIVTVLYAGSRYYSLAVMTYLLWMYLPEVHDWDYCQRWYRWSAGLTVPIEMFAGGILLLRTWGFSGRKIHYLIIFTSLYLTMLVYMLVITAKALELVPWFVVGQTRGKCITAGYSGNQLATGFWVAPLGFTMILTGVTLYESLRIRRQMPASKRSPVFRVFIRDGVMYLIVITATNTANVAFFAQQDESLKGSAMAFQFLFASLMSCRMVLSLRDTEVLAVQSAAASLATKSFWKTGYSGNEEEQPSQTGRRTHDRETGRTADSYQMNDSVAAASGNGTALPTYVNPLPIHVSTERAIFTSEKSSFKEDADLRF